MFGSSMGYGKIASFYHKIFGRLDINTQIRARIIFKELAIIEKEKSDKVLDIGCGDGIFSIEPAKIGYSVVGVDLNVKSVNYAKYFSKRSEVKIDFLVDDASHLPFANESFDIILCSEVLEHIKDDEGAIREIERVLKQNGLLILTVPSDKASPYPGHVRCGYSLYEISSKLTKSGINIINKKIVSYPFRLGYKLSFLLFPFVYPFALILSFISNKENGLIIIARKMKRSFENENRGKRRQEIEVLNHENLYNLRKR